jgi:hypothetical protein
MLKAIKILTIILIIIGLIYLALFTFGKRETIRKEKPKEFQESHEEAKRRYRALNLVLNSKKNLKQNLDFQFAVIYFLAKLGCLSMWLLPLLLLFTLSLIVTLNGVAIYITISVGLITGLYFLATGKSFNLTDFNEVLKVRIKNWVYGRSLHLIGDIEEIEMKTKELESSRI